MNYVQIFTYIEREIFTIPSYFLSTTVFYIVAGVKVNMQGSLRLGKDVVDSLSYYLGQNILNGRRSLMPQPIEDPITFKVVTSLLCKDLNFCDDEMQHFINEYIVVLAKAVETILYRSQTEYSTGKFEEQLKFNLEYIRHILEDAEAKVKDENYHYYWTQTIKKINAKFQNILDVFVRDAIDKNDKNKRNFKLEIRRKLVIATTFIERKYEIKLCSEHHICSKSHDCTTALNKILVHFKTLPEYRIRMFVKYVYESLFDSSFYNHLSESTAHEFQIILNDMAYSNDTPVRDIMLSVQKTVETRLEILETNKVVEVAHDILVAHVILSDLDHMHSLRTDPFIMFQNRFYDWLASDVQIDKSIKALVADIAKEIWSHDKDLVKKLMNEVNVFLEMTVDPDK